MGIHENFCAIFKNFDPDAFRALHHKEFMVIRELELSTLNDHCEFLTNLQ